MKEQPIATNFGRRASDRSAKRIGPVSYDGQPDWLDDVLARAHALAHKSPTLTRILDSLFDKPIQSPRLEFATFLDQSLRSAYDFNRLMVQFGGVPTEVEMKSVYGERWAFVRKCEGPACKWSVVFFDRDAVRMERQFDSAADALNVMVDDGYVLRDDAAMFRVSVDEAWSGGAQSIVSEGLSFQSAGQHPTATV